MKNSILFALILVFVVLACRSVEKSNGLIGTPDSMESEELTIQVNRDTTVRTKNGAFIKIDAGTLQTSDGNTVVLEIKEAYSVTQMIKANLTTTAGGEPLSSGGMFSITAKAGSSVKITKPIRVAIPATFLRDSMQLFSGKVGADNKIDWTNPAPIPKNKTLALIDSGKILFERNCNSCHFIDRDATGPALANIMKRDYELLTHVHVNYYRFADSSGDSYSYPGSQFRLCEARNFSLTSGPEYHLSHDQLMAIYGYIQNESDKNNYPMPLSAQDDKCIDSCVAYLNANDRYSRQQEELEVKESQLIDANGNMVEEIFREDAPAHYYSSEGLVSQDQFQSNYYQFTIENFGWYNIDILLERLPGYEPSELLVRIVGEYQERVQLYLLIPSQKILVPGGISNDNSRYAFFKLDGKIPLPQNMQAFILAVSETSAGPVYALKEFRTSHQQQFDISLQSTTIEAFNRAVLSIGGDQLKISVDNSKNSAEIRKVDQSKDSIQKLIEKNEALRPRGCNCQCVEFGK